MPLVWPRSATGGETRVCVWSEPGTRPQWKDGPWQVRRTEEIKDENSYPALVLVSNQPGALLVLELGDAAGIVLPAFRVDRALIQATVGDGGQQIYRAPLPPEPDSPRRRSTWCCRNRSSGPISTRAT